jgi:hypothetical protein
MPPLEISTQGTPNPNAAKFTLNRIVAAQGRTYRDATSAQDEWARQLLGIPGVTQVFAINNFISVTKVPEAAWGAIGPQVEAVLRRAFSAADEGQPGGARV